MRRLSPPQIINERAVAMQDATMTPDVIQNRIGTCPEEAAQAVIEEIYDAKLCRLRLTYASLLADLTATSYVASDEVSLLRVLLRAGSHTLLIKDAMRTCG